MNASPKFFLVAALALAAAACGWAWREHTTAATATAALAQAKTDLQSLQARHAADVAAARRRAA
ncbi:MAG TPA: hypothetical protein VHC86_14310, partial [Opitutaceae bacterium]|nr:hypothetical protein [Opitutaceae bacterium]